MSFVVNVPLSQLGKKEMALGRKLRQTIANALKVAARQSIPVLIARQKDAPPASDSPRAKPPAIASGAMVADWGIDYDSSPKALSVSIYNSRTYARFVEEGTKASPGKRMGRAGVDMIQKWMSERGIVLQGPGGKQMPANKAALIIANAIMSRNVEGYRNRPRRIVERAIPRIQEICSKRLDEALTKLALELGR